MATITPDSNALSLGFLLEESSAPIMFSARNWLMVADLVPFPRGVQGIVDSLCAADIDVRIGPTESLVAAMGQGIDPGFRIIAPFEVSPRSWSVFAGISSAHFTVESLRGARMGVTGLGSSSHIMGGVLASQLGWLDPAGEGQYSEIIVRRDFSSLWLAVDRGKVDFFLWETYDAQYQGVNIHEVSVDTAVSAGTAVLASTAVSISTMAYPASTAMPAGGLCRIGKIDTPWPSWVVVASTYALFSLPGKINTIDDRVCTMLKKLLVCCRKAMREKEETIMICVEDLCLEEDRVEEWFRMVKFAKRGDSIDRAVIAECVAVMTASGVLEPGGGELTAAQMVATTSYKDMVYAMEV